MFAKLRVPRPRSVGRFAWVTAALAAAAVMLSAQPVMAPATADTLDASRSTSHGNRRGALVDADHLRTVTAADVAVELASGDWDPGAVRYGVDTYRLVYRTVDPRGRPTTASGLLVLPRGGPRQLRTVSFTHGTELFRGDAPSVAEDIWGSAPAMTYASAGFATVAPDYLGLGVGPGPHPWKNVPSETTASLDMLRAARSFVPSTGRTLRQEVLVTGFSQGASAALGLARTLQEGADPRFRVQAVAPISGAYDMANAALPALLGGEVPPKISVIYLSLLIVAWDRLHGLYDDPGELIQEPYDRTIEELFNSEHPGQEVVAGTPDDPGDLLTPRAVTMLRNPTGRLAEALRVDASVCTDWTPAVPIRLYMVGDDVEAVPANTDHCQAGLRSRGVEVPVVDLGTGGHLNSNRLGTAQIVHWFSQLS
jgi:hypothetical protein